MGSKCPQGRGPLAWRPPSGGANSNHKPENRSQLVQVAHICNPSYCQLGRKDQKFQVNLVTETLSQKTKRTGLSGRALA